MAYNVGTDSLKARLKRLEDLAGKGQRNCPLCRLLLRRQWPDPTRMSRRRPEDFVIAVCDYCDTEYPVYLGIFPKEERDAWGLWLTCSWAKRYVDPKAHALGLWLTNRPQRTGTPANQQWQHHHQYAAAWGTAKGQTPGQRLVSQLEQKANDYLERYTKRLRAVFGEDPAREQRELIASVRARAEAERKERSHVKGLEWFETERTTHLIRAELEKIIWGEVCSKTSRTIAALESLINKRVKMKDEEEAQIVEAKQAKRRETEEAANRNGVEERRSRIRIKLENRYRRYYQLPLLADNHEGSFTPLHKLAQMIPSH